MLYTTLMLADALADRCAVVSDGRVVALGTPSELGGRDADSATVRWVEDGVNRSERTATPTAVVAALTARLGGEIPALQVLRPTLEETYLALVSPKEDLR